MLRTATALVVLAVLALVAVAAGPGGAHSCVRGNELWFNAADGTRLVGHRFGGTRPGSKTAVVLAHMSGGDLCQWLPYARVLARDGFFVFGFDFRGHGFSRGRPSYARLGVDVTAAVRTVRRLGARRVVVVGASLGGIATVVAAASIKPAVDGAVAVSAPAQIEGRLNALPFAPRIRVPMLYLAAEQDQNPPYDFAADARRLYEVTGTSEKRLEVVAGLLHGVFLVTGSTAVRVLIGQFVRDPRGTVRRA
jgi:alpha-beta hydrolase superfamily lysophospholipase